VPAEVPAHGGRSAAAAVRRAGVGLRPCKCLAGPPRRPSAAAAAPAARAPRSARPRRRGASHARHRAPRAARTGPDPGRFQNRARLVLRPSPTQIRSGCLATRALPSAISICRHWDPQGRASPPGPDAGPLRAWDRGRGGGGAGFAPRPRRSEPSCRTGPSVASVSAGSMTPLVLYPSPGRPTGPDPRRSILTTSPEVA
jgi:hypothetical protein